MIPKFSVPVKTMGPDFGPVNITQDELTCTERSALEEILARAGGSLACEVKEDGYRCQSHIHLADILLFSRGSKSLEVACFPDIVGALQSLRVKNTILDGELKGSGGYEGFKAIQKRVRYAPLSADCLKEYHDNKTVENFPLELVVFDVLLYKGKSCLELPLSERRKIVEEVANDNSILRPSKQYLVTSVDDLVALYRKKVLGEQAEGLVVKQPNLAYLPKDKKHWLKLKKFETLDVVVVGLNVTKRCNEAMPFGEALVAVYYPAGDCYQTLGIVSLITKNPATGNLFGKDVCDVVGKNVQKTLPETVVFGKRKADVYVNPASSVVLEVEFMNLNKGSQDFACSLDTAGSYTLRIATVKSLRDDKQVSQASTTNLVEKIYNLQK